VSNPQRPKKVAPPKGVPEILSNLFSEVNFRMETPEPTLTIKKG
jgi:hypothetical protein